MANNDTVYQIITDKMVAALTAGTAPWRKPWNATTDGPRNIEGRRYHGMNVFLLLAAGYDSPYWMTYNQAKNLGGQVRKGEKSTIVTYWKMLRVPDKNDPSKTATVPMLRYYNVFNLEQVDGIDAPTTDTAPAVEFTPSEAADKVIANYPNAPLIHHHGDQAYYSPTTDQITLPARDAFTTPDGYYSTAFHEMGHSTGHASRLARKDWTGYGFGSHNYGREELVAEMTAAFLAAETGITATFDNSAAYLASWIQTIQADVRAVVWAAGKAQHAADYILNREQSHTDDAS